MRRLGLRQQEKIAFSFTLIIVLSLGSASLMFNIHVRRIALDDARATMQDVATSISSRLDTELLALDRIALGVIGNKEIMDALVQMTMSSKSRVNTQLRRYEFQKMFDTLIFSLNTSVLTSPMISIIRPEQGDYYGWSIRGDVAITDPQTLKNIPWLKDAKAGRGARVILPPRQNELIAQEDIVFSVARVLVTPKNYLLGYLEVQQSYQIIIDAFSVAADRFHGILLSQTGEMIYQSNASETMNTALAVQSPGQSETQFHKETLLKTHLITKHYSPYTKWTIVLMRPYNEVFRASGIAFNLVLYSILGVLCISLIAIFLMSRRLTIPIRRLRNTIETMDLAHPNLTLNDTDSDEIKLLQKSFTKMMERLDESIHQQTQMQLAEMRSYQMALQSQITPHFLYNTLNTIAAMAKEGGNETIVSTCHNLSKMLRYSSNYDLPKVSLADELAHAIQYLTLLKTRYEELLEYTWSSEGPTDSIEVPRLIIQPLVENSYQHGLSRIAPPWIVSVKVRAWEDGSFKVSVTDNGAGFSAEALDTLDEQIAFMHEGLVTVQKLRCLEGKHVGLINTYSRLFLEYGEDVDLAVVNNAPGHCSVEIFVRKGKKRDLSHNDCRR